MTKYPRRRYPGDVAFNLLLLAKYRWYYKYGIHRYIPAVYDSLDNRSRILNSPKRFYAPNHIILNPEGRRVRGVAFFKEFKKLWNDYSKVPLTDFELNEFIKKKLASDENFNLEDYLKQNNSNKTMSNDKIIIPNSGGVTVQKVRDFKYYKSYYNDHHHNGNYPGDYSFNAYLIKFLKSDKNHNYYNFKGYIKRGDVVPHIVPVNPDDGGTIPNPRGGKVLKVPFFDELKIIWNRYDHGKSYTDFELNELLSKLLRTIPNFNLESYLKSEMKEWKIFKLRFPNADFNDFKGEHYEGDYNIYYQDTPIEVFGDHPAEKLNKQIMKDLGLSPGFPISLQLVPEKVYPIRGFNYNQKPPRILNEFKIIVSSNRAFHAKFRDIFRDTTVHFNSKAQCERWRNSPNLGYWPQQLNWIVWCATSGCGISLNENYPDRIQEFINFHIYFTIRRLLWEVNIPLPSDPFFKQTSNHYDKVGYQRVCHEFNIDENSDFRFRGGKNYGLGTIFAKGKPVPKSAGLVDWSNTSTFNDDGIVDGIIINLANEGRSYDWFTPGKGTGLTKAGLERLNRSVEAFVYCVVSAEVNTRSNISDWGGGGQEAQQEMVRLFEKAVIEEDISKSVQRYQLVVQEAKLRLDFAIAPKIWLIPTNLIINTESVVGYNNYLTTVTSEMSFGENKLLNNKIKTVGLTHNLGGSKKNQSIKKGVERHIIKQRTETRIDKNEKPVTTSLPSYEWAKATTVVVAGIIGYIAFR